MTNDHQTSTRPELEHRPTTSTDQTDDIVDERVIICPEVSVPTSYVQAVKAATDKLEGLLPEIEEAVNLAGQTFALRMRTWDDNTVPDGVPDVFDKVVGWDKLGQALAQLYTLAAVFFVHDEHSSRVSAPWAAGETPAWYLEVIADEYRRKVAMLSGDPMFADAIAERAQEIEGELRRRGINAADLIAEVPTT